MQIVVVAKEPRPGFAKTRLCPPCTPAEASSIAEASLRDTLQFARATPAVRHLIALEGDPGPWLPDGYDVVPQAQADFGRRLERAIVDAFRTCDEPVVLIGMDTPQVRPVDLLAVEEKLEHADDAVLGLALDGGWWVLGIRRHIPGLFDEVEMSVESTGAQQRDRLRAVGYRLSETSSMCDMDHFADAQAIAAIVPDSQFAATVRDVAAAVDARTESAVQDRELSALVAHGPHGA